MLASFPSPYPDEPVYGFCGRYHQHRPKFSPKAIMVDLFGTTTACAVLDLPNRLDHLCAQLHERTLLTADRMINQHTLLPLYRPFLPKDRLDKLVSWMKGSNRGGSIHMASGVMASGVSAPCCLRYCPECLHDDETKYGETYWHRCHQVAGVLICPIHECWLWESKHMASAQKHVYHLAPDSEPAKNCRSLEDSLDQGHCLMIARSVAWLLQAPSNLVPGLSSLRRRYVHHLQRLDLATYSGRIRQRDLLELFVSHYGPRFLYKLHCGIDPHSPDNWLSALARKPRKATHPLRHLLLIHFLGIEPEEFFADTLPAEKRPFGRGPWPCLNPVAGHYRKSVIRTCTVTRNSENGRPVGNFSCACGFGYARTGPDRDKDDRFRIGRMLWFGSVWEETLLDLLVGQRKGLRETARVLGVDTNTVKLHYSRLTAPRPDQPECDGHAHEREERRSRWLTLRNAHPQAGRKMLRSHAPADFIWLYRHDREWLQNNMPQSLTRERNGSSRVNWQQRDWRLASSMKSAATAILDQPGRPVRVTIGSIGKKAGVRTMLEKKLAKLPLTMSLLEKLVETREQFQIRRVQLAVEELRKRHEPLQVWRIVREARLRPGYSQAVAAEIERLVRETNCP